MPSTISDVAVFAGVSVATVSRVLNQPEIVSSKTKIKVLDAIARLDFEPDAGATTLGRRSNVSKRKQLFRDSELGTSDSRKNNEIGFETFEHLSKLVRENLRLRQIILRMSKEYGLTRRDGVEDRLI